ncbi:uncharacterized protein MYCGRDRAFT_96578 [Zymoseptoria tritici IPO323]|uniref:Uncharacterized protein n=1 Tax=Zymoseptoria tritici (strain CBS 115943 / IPO323) TaxID=336722 RepID=F9XMU8_ZYMTI|nr:uncharacterized protein MYCGRDRAFT_96578 [Zymoseptoria tritici IPO323]EGP83304.1 hypothetical protein MYCGRDRAFT_96578 [Zymoseptoria tritici IPO323]
MAFSKALQVPRGTHETSPTRRVAFLQHLINERSPKTSNSTTKGTLQDHHPRRIARAKSVRSKWRLARCMCMMRKASGISGYRWVRALRYLPAFDWPTESRAILGSNKKEKYLKAYTAGPVKC